MANNKSKATFVAPALTVTTCIVRLPRRGDVNHTEVVVAISCGKYDLFFTKQGPYSGYRFFNRLTGESRFANFDGREHWDYRPVHPSRITQETVEEITDRSQGPEALEEVQAMRGDCPAIAGMLKPVLRYFGL